MNTYTITSPSLAGLLTDDALYFEGIKRPLISYAIRETMPDSREHVVILERYFTDIYNLFLKKVAAFSANSIVSESPSASAAAAAETAKLQALLQEMIKVKGLIASANFAIAEKAEQASK